jgi:hypothetical protein
VQRADGGERLVDALGAERHGSGRTLVRGAVGLGSRLAHPVARRA